MKVSEFRALIKGGPEEVKRAEEMFTPGLKKEWVKRKFAMCLFEETILILEDGQVTRSIQENRDGHISQYATRNYHSWCETDPPAPPEHVNMGCGSSGMFRKD